MRYPIQRARRPAALSALSAQAALEAAFAWAARRRQARAFHPVGLVLHGQARLHGDATGVPYLDGGATAAVVVRLSKGAGTPGRLPDVLGIAVRFPDAGGDGCPLDLLVSSSAGPPGLRHLVFPSRSWQATYSSVMPYVAAGRLRLVGMRFEGEQVRLPSGLPELAAALATRPLRLSLSLAPVLGRWAPFATVDLPAQTGVDTTGVRWDPAHAVTGLRAWGPLEGARRAAYAGSRRGHG